MAPKAVDARKRHDRNRCSRGHGLLLRDRGPFPPRMAHPPRELHGPRPLLYSTQATRRTNA
jgi:hypothetical protein